jgi:TRAP-type C4-dicarboxylate transport system permease small subunit
MSARAGLASRVLTAERLLQKAEIAILVGAILGMTGLGFLQIVLRKGFSTGLLWADPLLRYLVLWMGFLGAAVAAAQDKHFGADVAERLLTGRTKILAQLVSHLFTAGACYFLARAAMAFMRDEFASKATAFSIGTLHVPTSWVEIILPAGFVLLLVHYLLRALAVALGSTK